MVTNNDYFELGVASGPAQPHGDRRLKLSPPPPDCPVCTQPVSAFFSAESVTTLGPCGHELTGEARAAYHSRTDSQQLGADDRSDREDMNEPTTEPTCGVCGAPFDAADPPPVFTLRAVPGKPGVVRPVLDKPIRMDPASGAVCWCPQSPG